MYVHPLMSEHTQVTVFLKCIADDRVQTHVFLFELQMIDEAISVAEQENFSVRQVHVVLGFYRRV